MKRLEFESLEAFEMSLRQEDDLSHAVFQSLDLQAYSDTLKTLALNDALFLGCQLEDAIVPHLLNAGALIFPKISTVPFNAYHPGLYEPEELMAGFEIRRRYAESFDSQVYQHYLNTGKNKPEFIVEALARRLHDLSITEAINDFVEGKRMVAIMGGHAMKRSETTYHHVALMARALTRRGYVMVSGGGPGAMEATHLGAYFAFRSEGELEDAIERLSPCDSYGPIDAWFDTAFKVKEIYPLARSIEGNIPVSLGIPTWLYGHEPPNIFASHIAKYFANSVREEGIISVAKGGIIFSPGSAGTIQEIFQDATQNHYITVDDTVSPMIFFNKAYWQWEKPVFPLMAQLAAGHSYSRYLTITDSIDDVVERIESYHQEA